MTHEIMLAAFIDEFEKIAESKMVASYKAGKNVLGKLHQARSPKEIAAIRAEAKQLDPSAKALVRRNQFLRQLPRSARNLVS